MTHIRLITHIAAPVEQVFNLSRDVSIHLESTSQTNEKVIAGRLSGLIGLGETVTWQGRHFGVLLSHKSRITALVAPHYFVDEMEKGMFRSFRHEHSFEAAGESAIMEDKLYYETPFGFIGKLFDKFFLENYMEKFLFRRNAVIKKVAEGNL
jgi:ligand-binding SRPBCC domain-containing protein